MLAVYGMIFLMTAVGMEGVAWLVHKYVMHGFLWVLHEDHHHPRGRGLQKNDLFAVFFALVSFGMIATGVNRLWPGLIAAGLGVALYGVGYFLFHEVMFHKRLRWWRLPARGRYLQRIVRAHSAHHRVSGKDNGVSFSFLYAPKRYDVADA